MKCGSRLGRVALGVVAAVGCTAEDAPRPVDDTVVPPVATSTTGTPIEETADPDGTQGPGDASGTDTMSDETEGESSGGPSEPRPPGPLANVCFEIQAPHPWSGSTPQFVGDITGNGFADTLTVSGPDGSASARVRVGRGGAGRWQDAQDSSLTGSPDVRLADVDGDGALDVVQVGTSLVTAFAQVDGTLTPASQELGLTGFTSAALLDFDVDGKTDVWLSSYDGRLEAHRGLGNGAFALASSTQLADALDGTTLYPGRSGAPSLGVMMGTAGGCLDCDSSAFSLLSFDARGQVALLGVVEFEAQWKLIAPTIASVYQGDRPEVFVDFGLKQRSVFGGETTLSIIGFLPNGATAFGDLNGDGVLELVILQDSTLRIYADGPEEVAPVFSRDAPDVPQLAVADADGDGWDDAILIDPVGYNDETGLLEPAITVMLSRPCPG